MNQSTCVESTAVSRRSQMVLACLWLTYVGFYFGRVNISVSLPGLRAAHGWTSGETGLIVSAFFWAYALGLLINGFFADYLSARLYLSLALLLSAAANMTLPFTGSLLTITLLWAGNGYIQSFGWPLVIKTIGQWFSAEVRGRAAAAISTSHLLGGAGAVTVAGYVVAIMGWAGVFTVHAAIMAAIAMVVTTRLRDSPSRQLNGTVADIRAGFRSATRRGSLIMRMSFGNRWLRGCALSLFFLNVVRHGFIVWAPTVVVENTGFDIPKAAFTAALFPVTGCVGAMFCGWLTDHVFGGRRIPVAVICLLLAGVFTMALRTVGHHWAALVSFGVIGGAVCGAHMLLVGVAPIDIAPDHIAFATGFIDSVGYLGAATTTALTGFLAQRYGWDAVFTMWAGAAFAGALTLVPLWNFSSQSAARA